MALKQIRRTCKTCEQKRLCTKPGVSHILHFLLCIPTVGFWLIVWGLLIVLNAMKPYRCTHCGEAKIL